MRGKSLSFCVRDIIENKVDIENVSQLYTSTCCQTDEQFEEVIQQYSKVYWNENPQKGIEIARKLWQTGRIAQPRLAGLQPPELKPGEHWF